MFFNEFERDRRTLDFARAAFEPRYHDSRQKHPVTKKKRAQSRPSSPNYCIHAHAQTRDTARATVQLSNKTATQTSTRRSRRSQQTKNHKTSDATQQNTRIKASQSGRVRDDSKTSKTRGQQGKQNARTARQATKRSAKSQAGARTPASTTNPLLA